MATDPTKDDSAVFDAAAKEVELQAESASWDVSRPAAPEPGDIPIVDLEPWRTSGSRADLEAAATVLDQALREVGFHQLVGHGIPRSTTDRILEQTERFHQLDDDVKLAIAMDRPDWPIGGVGYLPYDHHKLPKRATPNANAAFLIKRDGDVDIDANQWLAEEHLPGFRAGVTAYAHTISTLAFQMLPVYATALGLAPDFFNAAFADPFWRLRLTHYPAAKPAVEAATETFGISPHVDTTFMTLLLTDGPGLVIYSHSRQGWIQVPVVDDALVVNAGELLRQWSNDVVLSTRHYARNPSAGDRYSVPFFYNANADYVMECLPSCQGPDNPPRYPPISYRQSQGVVQGE